MDFLYMTPESYLKREETKTKEIESDSNNKKSCQVVPDNSDAKNAPVTVSSGMEFLYMTSDAYGCKDDESSTDVDDSQVSDNSEKSSITKNEDDANNSSDIPATTKNNNDGMAFLYMTPENYSEPTKLSNDTQESNISNGANDSSNNAATTNNNDGMAFLYMTPESYSEPKSSAMGSGDNIPSSPKTNNGKNENLKLKTTCRNRHVVERDSEPSKQMPCERSTSSNEQMETKMSRLKIRNDSSTKRTNEDEYKKRPKDSSNRLKEAYSNSRQRDAQIQRSTAAPRQDEKYRYRDGNSHDRDESESESDEEVRPGAVQVQSRAPGLNFNLFRASRNRQDQQQEQQQEQEDNAHRMEGNYVVAEGNSNNSETSRNTRVSRNNGHERKNKINLGNLVSQEDTNGDDYDGEAFAYERNSRYKGELNENGERHGQGTSVWENGDRYVGSFQNDVRTGHGKLYFAAGGSYKGEWKEGLMHGTGKRHFTNGDTYTGEYYNGKRCGKGKCDFFNGDLYVGSWRNDRMDGKGVYYYQNGQAFEGTFKRGRRHGRGNYQLSDGRMDVFLYNDGARIGDGVRWSDDRKKAFRLTKKKGCKKFQQKRITTKEALEMTKNMLLSV